MIVRRFLRPIAWLTVALALPLSARADLSTIEQANEAMMNSQGLILSLAVSAAGVDQGATLAFQSHVDPVAKTFSYALQGGTSYLGQPMSLSVSGAFDAPSTSWLWTSSGSIGAISLNGSGSTAFFGDPMSTDVFATISLDETIISDVTYENTAIRTVSRGTITIKDLLTGTVKSRGTHTDELILSGPDKGKWRWDTGQITGKNGVFALSTTGFSPVPDGGQGSFLVSVAVPEPSTLACALAFVAAGLGVAVRQGPHRRSSSGE